MPPNSQGPLPNFLIIGAQRSATRWLRSNLSEHPEILIPPWDVSYFSTGRLVRQGGERFYREQFESWDGEPFVGESSPNYMMWGSEPAVVARRIRDLVPDVRLIALVRQPVDRMYSAMLYQIKRGRLPADADLFGMVERGDPDVDKLDLVRAGLYAASLHPFRKLFGEQLLILVHDDVTDAPEKAYESALRHIGAVHRLRARRSGSCRLLHPHLGAPHRPSPHRRAAPHPLRLLPLRRRRARGDDGDRPHRVGPGSARGLDVTLAPVRELPPLPTFVIIGAQKSATRWLRFNLGEHPDIFASPYEISYFDHERRFALGEDFYRSQFEGWDGQPFLGEGTPGYLMFRNDPATVARRLADTVPDVRLFAVLRDPVDRARSALLHHIRYERLRPSTDLLTFVRGRDAESDFFGLVAGGWYAASLEPFVERFGDQLAVVLHDDIRDEPLAVYEQALRHVGAEPGFVAPELDQVLFSNRTDESGAPIPDDDSLSAEARAELFEYFRDDVDRLERLIERDLSAWKPAG